MTGDCCVFQFLRCSVEGKHLTRFQRDTRALVLNSLGVVCTKTAKPSLVGAPAYPGVTV